MPIHTHELHKTREQQVREALHKAIQFTITQPQVANIWAAREYAEAYLNHDMRHDEEEGKVQLLYLMNNLQYWRGEEARKAKEIIKKASQGKL